MRFGYLSHMRESIRQKTNKKKTKQKKHLRASIKERLYESAISTQLIVLYSSISDLRNSLSIFILHFGVYLCISNDSAPLVILFS